MNLKQWKKNCGAYERAYAASARAAEACRCLVNPTRARLTTANARWASAAEQRERLVKSVSCGHHDRRGVARVLAGDVAAFLCGECAK